MSVELLVLIIATALGVGLLCQAIGRRPRYGYQWAIGAVGALYGGLLATGIATFGGPLANAFPVVQILVGEVLGAVCLVLVVRLFTRHAAASHPVAAPDNVLLVRRLRVQYAPGLIEQPLVDRVHRQFGVGASVGQANIHGSDGWVDLELTGVPAALEAAVTGLSRSGIQVETDDRLGAPTLVAA